MDGRHAPPPARLGGLLGGAKKRILRGSVVGKPPGQIRELRVSG